MDPQGEWRKKCNHYTHCPEIAPNFRKDISILTTNSISANVANYYKAMNKKIPENALENFMNGQYFL